MAGPRFFLVAVVIAGIGSLLSVSCGEGGKAEEALISITLRLPDPSEEKTTLFSDRLLQAMEVEGAGRVTAVKKGKKLLELSVRIEKLSDINQIKRAIIDIEPAAEYRIEHR